MSEEVQKTQLVGVAQEIPKPTVMTLGESERSFAVLPPESTLHDVTLYMPKPKRVQQVVHMFSVQALVEYVNRFSTESTTVFADERKGSYEAVIDYHHGDEADDAPNPRANLEHRAIYACPQSEQWVLWNFSDKKWFGQEEFANFIECNLLDIVEPAGATLMQVALELQVHKGAQFSSEMRLENGQRRFRYDETVRGTTRAGDIEVPSAFTLGIPVFIDGKKFSVDARFRYRMVEGDLGIGYELIRPLEVFRAAVKQVTAEIKVGLQEGFGSVYAGVRA